MNINQNIKELAVEVYRLNTINPDYTVEILPDMPEKSYEEVTDMAIKIKHNNKTIHMTHTVNEEYFKFKDLEHFEPFDSPITYNGDFELERKISLKDNKKEFTDVLLKDLMLVIVRHEKTMKAENQYKDFVEEFKGEILGNPTKKMKP